MFEKRISDILGVSSLKPGQVKILRVNYPGELSKLPIIPLFLGYFGLTFDNGRVLKDSLKENDMMLGEGTTPSLIDDMYMQNFTVLDSNPQNNRIGDILLVSKHFRDR